MTEEEIFLTVVEDAKQMYLLGIRLSDCWCINWWLISGLSAKLCGFSFLPKKERKKKTNNSYQRATQKRDKQKL